MKSKKIKTTTIVNISIYIISIYYYYCYVNIKSTQTSIGASNKLSDIVGYTYLAHQPVHLVHI